MTATTPHPDPASQPDPTPALVRPAGWPSAIPVWEQADAWVAEHTLVIDRPAGGPHPRFPEITYPMDYGYLDGTMSSDGEGVDVWRGSAGGPGRVTALGITLDPLKRDAEVKLLVDCDPAAVALVRSFYETYGVPALVVERG